MRIVLVGPYPPYRGGIAHFAVSVRRELVERGHDVWAVTFSRQYPRLLFPGTTEFETPTANQPVPAIRALDSINPLSWGQTGRRIRGLDPGAILYSYWLPFFAPAYARVAGVANGPARQIGIVHNALPHERRPGDRVLSRHFLSRCDAILTMSESVEKDVRELVPAADIRRSPHPAYDIFGAAPTHEEARRRLNLPPEAPVALFFGFVRHYKGLHVLLESLPKVTESLPEFHLMVAGEFYEPRERYDTMIPEALSRHVRINDAYIAAEDVGCYFAAADVVVQPYVTATQSGVAQIAWQYERPLIVTDVGGLAEVVPDGQAGLVVPPDDAEALAQAITRFFRSGLAERLTEGARLQKAKYAWDPLIDILEDMMGVAP